MEILSKLRSKSVAGLGAILLTASTLAGCPSFQSIKLNEEIVTRSKISPIALKDVKDIDPKNLTRTQLQGLAQQYRGITNNNKRKKIITKIDNYLSSHPEVIFNLAIGTMGQFGKEYNMGATISDNPKLDIMLFTYAQLRDKKNEVSKKIKKHYPKEFNPISDAQLIEIVLEMQKKHTDTFGKGSRYRALYTSLDVRTQVLPLMAYREQVKSRAVEGREGYRSTELLKALESPTRARGLSQRGISFRVPLYGGIHSFHQKKNVEKLNN